MPRLLLAIAALAFASPAYAQSVPQKYDSTASTNATLVRPGNALLTVLVATNSTATIYYLKIYDSVIAPTCGSGTPVLKIAVPTAATGGQVVVQAPSPGMQFFGGIGFCLTAGIADSDTGNAAAGVTVNFAVKQ